VVFSKIQRKKWPSDKVVLRNLKRVLEEEDKENEEEFQQTQ